MGLLLLLGLLLQGSLLVILGDLTGVGFMHGK